MAKVKLSGQCEDCRESPVMTRPRRKYTRCEDCRRNHVLVRLNARKVKRGLRGSIGRCVQYNNNDGWRVGYMVRATDSSVSIQPIGARGTVPDIISVPFAGVKPEPMQSPSCPTIEDFYRMNEKKKVVVLVAGGRMATAIAAAIPRELAKVVVHGSEPLQTMDGTLVPLPKHVSCDGEDMDVVEARAAARFPEPVQEPNKSTRVGAVKHAPVNSEDVIRMYNLVPRPKMSEIVEAVRGARAAGATGNICRDILRKAGIYEEPVK